MPSVLSPYTKIIEAVVLAVALYFGYQWIGDKAVDKYKVSEQVAQAKVDKAKQESYDKLANDYEEVKATRQSNTNTITKTYEKVIEKPVYSNVCIEPSGVQLANEAIAGKRSSQFDAKVPSNPTP